MTDLLAAGAAWLESKRRANMSQAVTYARGSSSAADVPATPGRSIFEIDSGNGVMLRVESQDFLIGYDDLVLSSVHVEPVRGDRITDAAGVVFEVLPVGPNAEWRWADGYRNTYRIHVKQVSP